MESITLQYCSDLHLEFPENKKFVEENPIQKHGDILILGGDIVPFSQMDGHKDFFDRIGDQFQHVYWIPGNHEYYYSDIQERSRTFSESIRTNITLLNNSVISLSTVNLVFSTLWTRISTEKIPIIENRLSDFFVISSGSLKLSAFEYNQMHDSSLMFIKNSIAHLSGQKNIVITHHVPTFVNYPPKFVNSPINQAFAVDLNEMICTYEPDHWIFGHSHVNIHPFSLCKTQMHTNQLGYIRYNEHVNYRQKAVIEV